MVALAAVLGDGSLGGCFCPRKRMVGTVFSGTQRFCPRKRALEHAFSGTDTKQVVPGSWSLEFQVRAAAQVISSDPSLVNIGEMSNTSAK